MEKNFVEKIENVESFVNEVILNAIKNNASDSAGGPQSGV